MPLVWVLILGFVIITLFGYFSLFFSLKYCTTPPACQPEAIGRGMAIRVGSSSRKSYLRKIGLLCFGADSIILVYSFNTWMQWSLFTECYYMFCYKDQWDPGCTATRHNICHWLYQNCNKQWMHCRERIENRKKWYNWVHIKNDIKVQYLYDNCLV